MERKAQAIKDCILKQPVWKKETLHPKTWLKSDHVKGFTEFILPKDIEEDGGYDCKEMLLEVEKDFIEAAKRNDVEGMKLLGRGVNVNAKNVNGRTALHYAVAFRNVEVVDVLLRRRAKLDFQDKEGLNMMHCAAMNNHTDIVAYIVDDLQMGELDKEDQYGNRPFALAAVHGCVSMLQMLMEEPYNMATMEENKVGDTPLHLAAKNGQCEALQLLLDNFSIRNEVNQAGQTALYLAADGAHEDCVQTLLEAQCDPNIFTLSRSSPLHPVCERGHFPIVKLLINSGAQMNAQNQHLHTPFHLAVKNCHIPVIHTLLEAGCDPNVKDHMGQTALHIAAEMGKVDVVEMILKAGVDLEIQDRQNKSALGVAVRGNMVIIVDMIIKAERYFRWKHDFQMTNTDAFESLHSESPLTFKLDHSPDMKPVRDIIWDLGYKHLKRNDWKKLAEFWEFTDDQVAAIEEQWTGPNSFQEHGNRMLLIWLHGIMIEGSSPAKGLHEALLSVGITKIAEKIRMEGTNTDTRKCTVS
ncbi:ankyrin repeat and death domain-containing protein 1B isoform X2 [Onychostoma macrolepis]|uniref:ankyrin repeat and death domain-containing protein 1B isoform X2 n=1 Tax=Onychostoma macrolepis TaxID=369639 RepID=UPI00272C0224|nr:ankyrin repeat and death domain-containing protein 1B isoform X2 [Onychostoma macrolepis]